MNQYLELMAHILDNGEVRTDRTGTGTKSVFGYQMRFNLAHGFPLVTTKKLHLRAIIHELLWIISGSTNNNDLEKHGVKIWREWAREDGDLGPIYGHQMRCWGGNSLGQGGIDQISNLVSRLKSNPDCRRHIVSSWNVSDLPEMALSPCHAFFQCYVSNSGKLSLHLYQRSADVFIGCPFNIASYALLTHMLADVCGLQLGEFIHTFGDAHLYLNHLHLAEMQLARTPRPLPTLRLRHRDSIDDYVFDDVEILDYDPHPAIKAEVSV